eukprot:ANDGO_03286.mRNA.1 Protein phosphatase 1 regulatory subunit 42 OS=Macaca fascicularis GN=PPP1R42 PE=2 SV=1
MSEVVQPDSFQLLFGDSLDEKLLSKTWQDRVAALADSTLLLKQSAAVNPKLVLCPSTTLPVSKSVLFEAYAALIKRGLEDKIMHVSFAAAKLLRDVLQPSDPDIQEITQKCSRQNEAGIVKAFDPVCDALIAKLNDTNGRVRTMGQTGLLTLANHPCLKSGPVLCRLVNFQSKTAFQPKGLEARLQSLQQVLSKDKSVEDASLLEGLIRFLCPLLTHANASVRENAFACCKILHSQDSAMFSAVLERVLAECGLSSAQSSKSSASRTRLSVRSSSGHTVSSSTDNSAAANAMLQTVLEYCLSRGVPRTADFRGDTTNECNGTADGSGPPDVVASSRTPSPNLVTDSELSLISRFSREKKFKYESNADFCARLTHLFMNQSELRSLPDVLNCLPNLSVLYAYGNQIKDISALSRGGTLLSSIYLQDNAISDLSPSVCISLCNVRKLFLDHNAICELSGLECMSHLEELHVSHQQGCNVGHPLTIAPASLEALSKTLRILNIAGNGISTLGPFSPMRSLEVLIVAKNDISDTVLEETLQVLRRFSRLQEVDFRGNPICSLGPKLREHVIVNTSRILVVNGSEVKEQDRMFVCRFSQLKKKRDQQEVPIREFADSEDGAAQSGSEDRSVHYSQHAESDSKFPRTDPHIVSLPPRTSSVPSAGGFRIDSRKLPCKFG